MRLSRLKFTEIQELKDWISLLIDERSFNSITQSNALAKIASGEYAESDLFLFAITKDELLQRARGSEEDNELIDNLIMSKKLELRLKFQERDRAIKKFKSSALSIKYKFNKKENKIISVRSELLDRVVHKIMYYIDREKDSIRFAVIFADNSMQIKSVGLNNLLEVIVLDL